MRMLLAVVKPFRIRAIFEALEGIELLGGSLREVRGYGRQKNRLHRYLGADFDASFVPKVELTLWVGDNDTDEAAERMAAAARTGRIGDGKILIFCGLDASPDD